MAKQIHVTASVNNVASTGNKLAGYIVNSHSSGTIKAWDNVVGSGSEYLHDTFTFPAGSGVYRFPSPLEIKNGLSFVVGGTLNAEAIIE